MRTTLVSIICVIGTFASIAYSQDGPPQYEHIKGLEPFIGEWEGKYDPPGDVPLGTVRVRCHWLGNKSYCHFEGLFISDGVDLQLNPVNIFIGYSGKTKAVHSWHLDLGSQAEAPVMIVKNKVVIEIKERHDVSGGHETRTSQFELRSPDELVGTNTNIVRNGEARPDEQPLVLKRVK